MKKFIPGVTFFILSLVWVLPAHAATLNVIGEKDVYPIGQEFSVDIKIDSEDQGINAAQATLQFDKTVVEAVRVDKTGSIFDFWLTEPTITNEKGQIAFVGASTKGYSGKSLEIFRVTFRSKGAGKTNISFTDAAITAADGSGTNVLSKINGLALNFAVPEQISTGPVQITRTPQQVSGLPALPVISVPLYPDPLKWNDVSGRFFVKWKLPSDVTGVAIQLNKTPLASPNASQGLFDSEEFPPLADGIYYLHVRFENAIGWGPVAHYRIAVDTTPPQGFTLNIVEGAKTDNPTPTLQFRASDALSGLKEYQIKVGDEALIRVPLTGFTGNFKLPLQPPGKQKVFVRAIDQAGNGTEQGVDMEILPITAPTITFVTQELFSEDDQSLLIKGAAVPGLQVLVKLEQMSAQEKGAIVSDGTVYADEHGNWEFSLSNQSFKNGYYVVVAQAQDKRGALSFSVQSGEIQVKPRPLIQIGIFQLNASETIALLLLLIIGGFVGGVWYNKKRQGQIALRVGFTQSEITKIFMLIKEDIEKISASLKTSTPIDDEYALKKLRENIQKMETYLKKGVEKIKS